MTVYATKKYANYGGQMVLIAHIVKVSTTSVMGITTIANIGIGISVKNVQNTMTI